MTGGVWLIGLAVITRIEDAIVIWACSYRLIDYSVRVPAAAAMFSATGARRSWSIRYIPMLEQVDQGRSASCSPEFDRYDRVVVAANRPPWARCRPWYMQVSITNPCLL